MRDICADFFGGKIAGGGLILPEVTGTADDAPAPPLRSDLATLVKARLNTFVLITAFFGFYLAVRSRGGWLAGDWLLMIHTIAGTAAAAFGASVFNQLMEIREDARMRRTSNRPLPAQRVLILFLGASPGQGGRGPCRRSTSSSARPPAEDANHANA